MQIGVGLGIAHGRKAGASAPPAFSFLSFNGTSDFIQTPSFSWDEVIMDFSSTPQGNFQKYLGLGNAGFIQVAAKPVDSYSADFSAVYVNGSQVTNSTDFIPNDTRVTMRALKTATSALATFLFRQSTNAGYVQGKLYSIRFLLGGVEQAFYNMATGSVQDQSGNGRHATLNGGTWT